MSGQDINNNSYLKSLAALLVFSLNLMFLSASNADSMLYLEIEEVSVNYDYNRFFSDSRHLYMVDSTSLQIYQNGLLPGILFLSLPANIRQNSGAGSVASISTRGTLAEHTRVNWNGFSLNSKTLGMTDLSTLSAGFYDEIIFNPSASGCFTGNNSIGGVLELENAPDWNNRLHFDLSSELGSFASEKYYGKTILGNANFQSDSRFVYQEAENNYPYTYGKTELPMKRNAYNYHSFSQNVFSRLPGNQNLHAGLLYYQKEKNIPPLLGSFRENYEVLSDKSIKTFLKWKKVNRNSLLSFRTGVFYDYQHYLLKNSREDTVALEDSKIQTTQYVFIPEYRWYISNHFIWHSGLEWQMVKADVAAYQKQITEHQTSLYSALKLKYPNTVANAGIRSEISALHAPKFLFSVGAKQWLSANVSASLNLANKFRIPTLNERYWQPYGDPDLPNEESIQADATLQWKIFNKERTTSAIILNGYWYKTKNLIQWITVNSQLKPESYKKTEARGIELGLNYFSHINLFSYRFNLFYTYTHAVLKDVNRADKSIVNNYIPYIPDHTLKGHLMLQTKWIYLGSYIQYSAKRYTTDDNNEFLALPAFLLSNIYMGTHLGNRYNLNLTFRIENITDIDYQLVKAYPMPGRAYYITLNVGFKQ